MLGRYDDGIEFSTVTYLVHGRIPFSDFYSQYGVGLGIPGAIPYLLGFHGAFALRLVYGSFCALATLLGTVFVWRRCGPPLGALVGLLTIVSGTPRYSIGWSAVFGFALLVDAAARRTAGRELGLAALREPRPLLLASFVLSMAGWARVEYALFPIAWAIVLAFAVPRGRRRTELVSATIGFALLPTLVVAATGGLRHLWWFISYTLSPSMAGFHTQRGQPIEWHTITDRISELWHLQLSSPLAGVIVGSYGVGLLTVAVAVVLLLTRAGRTRLLARDRTFLLPFMLAVCAIVLYAQSARFSTAYGLIAVPIFWAAAALLIGRRISPGALTLAVLIFAYPLLTAIAPGAIIDAWKARPDLRNRPVIPHFDYIPIQSDGSPESLSALPRVWRQLGLQGRATIAVNIRNDVAWGNDAIVGYVLDVAPAAWETNYDPGVANSDRVERETVAELCANHAPVVQFDQIYPYSSAAPVYVGSRRLDEFLAVNYRPRAIAGFYRILLPASSRCTLPERLDLATLAATRDSLIAKAELSQAGAVAIAILERERLARQPLDSVNAAVAALGGYALTPAQVPAGLLGSPLKVLAGDTPAGSLAAAAAAGWPSDLEALAAQTAWINHRQPGEPSQQAAATAVAALAARHPDWPTAIANDSAIQPPSEALFRKFAAGGARGATFDAWRFAYYVQHGPASRAIAAGLALIDDYDRVDDPVQAGQAELKLAAFPGVTPGCALLLTRHANARPGVRAPTPPGGPPCLQPELATARDI